MGKEYPLDIEGRAFLLRPDMPPEGRPREPKPGEMAGQLSEPLRSQAEELGLSMQRPSFIPYTLKALEATEFAKEQGQFLPFHLGLYHAYWAEGQNLGDDQVLEGVVQRAGLAWDEVKAALETGRYREQVLQQFSQAMALGFRAIPTFLVGNIRLVGAQPYSIFKTAAERALAALSQDSKAFDWQKGAQNSPQ